MHTHAYCKHIQMTWPVAPVQWKQEPTGDIFRLPLYSEAESKDPFQYIIYMVPSRGSAQRVDITWA